MGSALRCHRAHLACGGCHRSEPGQAEVEDLGAPIAHEEQIFRFQVAVNDALIVSGGQSAGYLCSHIDCLAYGQRTMTKHVAQSFAL